MIKIGKTYYEGSGNRLYGVLAKVKILREFEQSNQQFYDVEIIKNYATKWKKGFPKAGEKTISTANSLYDSLDKAKDNFMKDMQFENDKDIIRYIFK